MKIFFVLLCSIVCCPIKGQYINTSYADAVEIKKRILLLALPEEDKYYVKENEQSPQHLNLYRNDLKGQSKAFKKVFLHYWNFSDSIVVLPLNEAKTLQKNNPGLYAILRYSDKAADRAYVKNNYTEPPFVSWTQDFDGLVYNPDTRYDLRMLMLTSLVIELPKRAIEIFLPKMSPSEGDFIEAVHRIDYMLSSLLESKDKDLKKLFKQIKSVSEELKTKILLLDIEELDSKKGLRTDENIRKHYPYPFKIVSYEEIEEALKREDSTYAIVTQARHEIHNSTYTISNAGSGKIYFQDTGSTFDYGEIDGTKYTIQVFYPGITSQLLEWYGRKKSE